MDYRNFPHINQYFYLKDKPYLYYVSEINKDYIIAQVVNSPGSNLIIYKEDFYNVEFVSYFYVEDFIKIIEKDIVKFQKCEFGKIIKITNTINSYENLYTIKLTNGNIINLYNDNDKKRPIFIKIKDINKMEENNMNEKCKDLLKGWIRLNTENYNKKQETEIEKIINRDMVSVELSNRLNEVEKILNEFKEKYPECLYNFGITSVKPKDVLTDDSKNEIQKIERKYDNLKDELRDIANEVSEATSICETEESLRKVLKSYGIIDINGKIKIK